MFQRAFSVSTREPAALLFVAGGGSPTGVFVAWCNIGTFVRLCFGVSCDICAGAIVLTSRLAIAPGRHVVAVAMSSLAVAVVTRPWRPWVWPWRGAAVAVAPAVFLPPSCGCDTPTNASVCNGFATSHYPDLRNQLVAYKMGANKQTTTKRKERYSSGYADRDGNPGAPKNRRHG